MPRLTINLSDQQLWTTSLACRTDSHDINVILIPCLTFGDERRAFCGLLQLEINCLQFQRWPVKRVQRFKTTNLILALLQPKERNPTLTSHQVHCKFFFHQTHSFNSTFHHEQFIRSTSCFSCYLWSAYVRYNENKNAGVALTNGLFTVAAAFSLANSYFILASCVLKK